MKHHPGIYLFLVCAFLVSGCETIPSSKVHYTIKQDPGSRPLQQIVLLPINVDVYEMSAGGVREEVPEWSSKADMNVREALLVSKDVDGECCVTRQVDSSTLTPAERDILEEHIELFDRVAGNALWATLPGNTAWHFKAEHFDYTLGDGLSFLKTKYGLDAGLIIIGEDVVTTAGRKTTVFVAAMFGVGVPLGHSFLVAGLVDFTSGDLLWMNHEISAGGTDLRDPESCLEMAGRLMKDYPGLESVSSGSTGADN